MYQKTDILIRVTVFKSIIQGLMYRCENDNLNRTEKVANEQFDKK